MNKGLNSLVSYAKASALVVLLGILLAVCGGGGGVGGGSNVVAISATATTTAQTLTVGTAMSSFTPLTASGGATPYTYSYTGILPTGLSFNPSTGAVTGTPTVVYAATNLVFSVVDANNVVASTTSTVSFTVNASGGGSAISATATTTAQILTAGTAMTSFTPLTASGGVTPYTFSYTGTLPTGLSFNVSTGAVTGIPTASYATANLVFSVKDANNVVAGTTSTVSFTVSGGGAPTNPVYPSVTTHYFQGFPGATSAVGGLSQVRSDTPASPTVVDATALSGWSAAGTRIATIKAGNITSFYNYAVVYSSGGKLYKQYAGATTPPMQISTIANIGTGLGNITNGTSTDLCAIESHPDLVTPDSSVLMVSLAGADKSCGSIDDVYLWTRLSADSLTAPAPLPGKILQAVYDPNTWAVTGFVGLTSSGALAKFDANLANPVTINAGPFFPSNVNAVPTSWANSVLLKIATVTTNGLYVVNTNTNIMSSPLFTFAAGNSLYATDSDSDGFYFSDSFNVIRMIAASGTSTATTLATAPGWVSQIWPTTNSVIYSGSTSGGSFVSSIAKTGGTAVSLATGTVASGTGDEVILSTVNKAGYVYYQRRGYASSLKNIAVYKAEIVKEDGTGKITYGNATNPAFWSSPFYYNRDQQQIMLIEAATSATDFSGASVSVVDMSTGNKNSYTQSTTLPSGLNLEGLGSYINGPRGIMLGGFATQNDIFFIDPAVSNSFTRVTNTSGNKDLVW